MKYVSPFVKRQKALNKMYRERGRVLWSGAPLVRKKRLKGKAVKKREKKIRRLERGWYD